MTRELLTGKREEVLGNFTFRYLCRFFSVHLLTIHGGVVWLLVVDPEKAMREIEIVTASVVLDQVVVTVWLTPRFAIRVPRDAIAI